MALEVENQPTVSIVSARVERVSMAASGNVKDDEGRVAETVIQINSEETSSISSARLPTSEFIPNESATIDVPSKEQEIVITVDRPREEELARGTTGCSINSSEERVSENCPKNSSATDLNKDVNESELTATALRRSETSRSVGADSEEGPICRICHLTSEQALDTDTNEICGNAAASELIQLGCGCKDELGIAHSLCAEAWFKLKGNRLCEICDETAENISGVWDDRFIDKWNDRLSVSSNTGQSEQGGCWRGQPLCNFLMACLLIAFVLPRFFGVKMF